MIAIEQVRRITLILSPHEPRLLHQGPRVSKPPGLALAAYSISNTAAGPASSNSSNLIRNYLIACLATRLLCCHSLGLCSPRRCQPTGRRPYNSSLGVVLCVPRFTEGKGILARTSCLGHINLLKSRQSRRCKYIIQPCICSAS